MSTQPSTSQVTKKWHNMCKVTGLVKDAFHHSLRKSPDPVLPSLWLVRLDVSLTSRSAGPEPKVAYRMLEAEDISHQNVLSQRRRE